MELRCGRCGRDMTVRNEDEIYIDGTDVLCKACEITVRLIEPGTIVEYHGPMMNAHGLWVVSDIQDDGTYVLARGNIKLKTSRDSVTKG